MSSSFAAAPPLLPSLCIAHPQSEKLSPFFFSFCQLLLLRKPIAQFEQLVLGAPQYFCHESCSDAPETDQQISVSAPIHKSIEFWKYIPCGICRRRNQKSLGSSRIVTCSCDDSRSRGEQQLGLGINDVAQCTFHVQFRYTPIYQLKLYRMLRRTKVGFVLVLPSMR